MQMTPFCSDEVAARSNVRWRLPNDSTARSMARMNRNGESVQNRGKQTLQQIRRRDQRCVRTESKTFSHQRVPSGSCNVSLAVDITTHDASVVWAKSQIVINATLSRASSLDALGCLSRRGRIKFTFCYFFLSRALHESEKKRTMKRRRPLTSVRDVVRRRQRPALGLRQHATWPARSLFGFAFFFKEKVMRCKGQTRRLNCSPSLPFHSTIKKKI